LSTHNDDDAMKRGKRPDATFKVEAVLYATVHTDAAACERFGISTRTLRTYREQVRDEESEVSEVFNAYAAAISPEAAAADFLGWMQDQVKVLSALILEKGREINPKNPEGLRALTEHMGALLNHAAALHYMKALFEHRSRGG
jgi:hypothetical protein